MADKHTYVQVGKYKVQLSNLQKLLFDDPEITKAAVIAYYYEVSGYLLQHSRGRPISTIRYPDGINGEHFYFKDIPSWAPDWIQTVRKGGEHPKNYLLLNDAASVVWLANLAAIEFHQAGIRETDFPDYIVYDLDPPEGMGFEEVKDVAFRLKEHLLGYGYTPFVKVSGKKGIHIFTPVNPKYSINECFEAARNLIQSFIKVNKNTTLEISKIKRKGRMLLDIYRNRNGQTVVCPYSLRAIAGAPVSLPLDWQELESVLSSDAFSYADVTARLKKQGDSWEGMGSFRVPLHTDKEQFAVRDIGGNARRKSAEQLQEYENRRDFSRTTEPQGGRLPHDDTVFVVHRHNASHLHYDLRLAREGVLKSWALPKGLPQRPGVKRLAVATEDHPMEYLDFEGDIPKKEYGGGRMWIFLRGKYEITRQKKDGFYFRLNAAHFQAEYRMHNTRNREWLIERVDNPVRDLLASPPLPMLASQQQAVPAGDYIYELKWDGIRAIFCIEEDEIRIFSRNGNEITGQFPEFTSACLKVTNAVLDAEIVCFDRYGKPDFRKVLSRLNKKVSRQGNAYAYVFDLLAVDGVSILHEPLWRRRWWLSESMAGCIGNIRFSREEEDGAELFEATKRMGLEGILAKQARSVYRTGERSEEWIKVKSRREDDVLVIGYTRGENDRADTFGALHIAAEVGNELVYRGKVGTGFTDKQLKELSARWPEAISRPDENIRNLPELTSNDVWLRPDWSARVRYASITGSDVYREPVFIEMINI